MRILLRSLVCASLLLVAAPAVTYASTPYFTSESRSSLDSTLSHDFPTGISGSVDVVLMNRGPASWYIGSGRFPAGMGIHSVSGDPSRSLATIDGTPTEEGTFPVHILAIVNGNAYPLDYTVNTYAPTLTIGPIGVAQGRVGLPYSQTLIAGGSTSIASDLYWGISAGALPPGLSLNSTTGEISGTPTTAGEYRFLVRMNERSGRLRNATPREYLQTIQPASVTPVHITTRSNPVNGQVGVTYPAQIFRAEGSNGGITWAVTGGTLPPGLSFTTGGILQGTPTTAGTYTFDIKARDLALETNSDALTVSMSVAAAAGTTPAPTPTPTPTPAPTPTPTPTGLALTTTVVPNGTVGVDYSTSLSASGGSAPYSWNFASGVLPPGLSLSANGVVSGRPTAAGTYTAYIEVFDATHAYTGRSLTFTINAAGTTPAPTPTPLPTPSPTPTPTTPASPTASTELTTRLNNLARIGLSAHALVKLPDDGNRFTQADSAVYYVGADGRRHAFPNDRVYATWYSDFSGVRVVSASDLASIPLGANVTYKPGSKMVKFTSDPKVYAVSSNRTLRWITTEAAAVTLYGSNWNHQIDDVSDTFYTDYTFGADVSAATDFDRAGLMSTIRYVSDVLPL